METRITNTVPLIKEKESTDPNQPCCSGLAKKPTKDIITPERLRPYPKASARKPNRVSRRKRESAILTDTPVKDQLEEERNKRLNKKSKKKEAVKRSVFDSEKKK